MHQFLFLMSLLYSSTCFEHNRPHHQEVKIVSHSIWHHHTLQAAVRCTGAQVHRTALSGALSLSVTNKRLNPLDFCLCGH